MPKKPDLNEFRLRTGALFNQNQGIVLAGHKTLEEDDIAHTFEFMWRRDSSWAGRRQSWTSAIVGYAPPPQGLGVTVAEDGDFHAWGDGDESEGVIATNEIFRSVDIVDRHLYAVGMGASVYRCDSINCWTRLNLDIPSDNNFETIAGFSEKEMYAAGWNGSICYIREDGASIIDSPTNVILTDACCGHDGLIYCCGQGGVIVKGREDKWEIVSQDDTNEDFWSIVYFQGKIYISTALFLYTLEDQSVKLLKFQDDLPRSFYHLSSFGDDYLWSIGPDDLMGFDGKQWERIL